MMSRIPLAAAVLVTLALAGCAADGGDSASNASGAPSATSTTAGADVGTSGGGGTPSGSQGGPGTTNSAGTTNGDTLLTFTRQGGLAGVNDRLVLRPDGSYTLQTRSGTRSGKLTAQELAAMKATLDATDFNKMPSVNDNNGVVADGFTYSVSYAGREIMAQDGAIPPALQPVVGALSAILSR